MEQEISNIINVLKKDDHPKTIKAILAYKNVLELKEPSVFILQEVFRALYIPTEILVANNNLVLMASILDFSIDIVGNYLFDLSKTDGYMLGKEDVKDEYSSFIIYNSDNPKSLEILSKSLTKEKRDFIIK